MAGIPETEFRIHPAIGVARMGNAPGTQCFIGPEVPGAPPQEQYKFRGRVRPQAARFRVWRYERREGALFPVGEALAGKGDVESIEWTVHLANRKAAFFEFDGLAGERGKYHGGLDVPRARLRNPNIAPAKLTIDPGPRTIAGRAHPAVPFRARHPVIRYLGELRTDPEGRLIVIGGRGESGSLSKPAKDLQEYANNPTWVDDASDGPVTARVKLRDGTVVDVGGAGAAWVLVGPPDFAPEITPIVTLYDLMVDLAARKLEIPDEFVYRGGALTWLSALNTELRGRKKVELRDFRPDFERDVFPIFERASQLRWVHGRAAHAHVDALSDPALADPSPRARRAREEVMRRLRPPDPTEEHAGGTMPRLLGDEAETPLVAGQPVGRRRFTLTPTQYAMLLRWRDGEFDPPERTLTVGEPRPVPSAAHTPWDLDRASLEACVGGAFFPGIEVGWQIRHEELYVSPFRIRHGCPSTYAGEDDVVRAGHFSRQMAVPWQADFDECRAEAHPDGLFGWWPTQRPDDVFGEDGQQRPWARFTNGDDDFDLAAMQAHWYKLGFVLRRGRGFVESDRSERVP